MLRILQSVNIMNRAGLETMLMNYYRKVDRSKIQFDFLTHRSERGVYDDEIETMGGRIYYAPRLYPQNYVSYYRYMKCFFAEHPEYSIIHSHIDAMSAFPLFAAKLSGLQHRIAHSHNTKLNIDMKLPIKFAALKIIPSVANVYCSCGMAAGEFMFEHRAFKVINNAISLMDFAYDENIRNRVREKMNLHGKIVIGHVGRFNYVKNQELLIGALCNILQINRQYHLILIGKGEDEEKLRKKIQKLGLIDHVSVLIDRSDVAELYQAMDIFAMPSLFEGLPVVAVEAQANGLPCIFSDKISKEVLLSDHARMLSLESGEEVWAQAILETEAVRNPHAVVQLREKGYDIDHEARKLQQWYEQLAENQ